MPFAGVPCPERRPRREASLRAGHSPTPPLPGARRVAGDGQPRLRTVIEQRPAAVPAEAEAALDRLAAVLEGTMDAIVSVDRAWRLTYVNRRAEALVGRSRD